MTNLLYDLGIHFFAFFKVLGNWKKYRGILGARLGKGFPKIEKSGKRLVWIHAVSMGETKAIAPLITKIKSLKDAPLIILSTVTQTGHHEGKKSLADYTVYLPFDFPYVIRPIVSRLRPDLVILTETDFWYHFQDAAKKSGAHLAVVNAKLSERSFLRYRKFPSFVHRLLAPVDHFYVQNSLYEGRLQKLGIPSEKISVTGNIKLDAPLETADIPTCEHLGLKNRFVVTLGSTHPPEERIWIQALKELWREFRELKVLIVPRHPERFDEVARLLEKEQLPYSRWSQKGRLHSSDVLLVDAMGVLKTCYQLSDIAFVGGSFNPHVGGHNILEPSFYGKPVLFGPHMESQPDLLDLALSYQAGIQIMPEDIVSTVRQLITDSLFARQLGENGLRLLAESRGALGKTFNALQPLLEKRPTC
ncbi:MAG: 3-deoxy-D-manno-octulosonic acid transferase [Chlamydiales bacterium]|nr:3-deoxy-D-manno-octulosonic acid transferase [Chlamydiales bacterium]